MIYKNEKTRPGGPSGNPELEQIPYLRALLAFETARSCVLLRERTSNMRQLWHVFATSLFFPRSPIAGGVR